MRAFNVQPTVQKYREQYICGIDPVSGDFKRLSIAGWFMIDQVAESRPKENGDSAVKNDVEWTFRKMTTHRAR